MPMPRRTGHRIAARTARAWGRFRQAAVSSFAFVEAAGPLYAGNWCAMRWARAKGPRDPARAAGRRRLTAEGQGGHRGSGSGAMSLTEGHGKIVLLLGHGGQVTNNPHESAYHCGACGGYTGEVSARLLAVLLNDPETSSGLDARAWHSTVPGDTLFVAGLHDTTTDEITIYDDGLPKDGAERRAISQGATGWRRRAGSRGPSGRRSCPADTRDHRRRALNWAEVRPEWGLAGCAAFIAAPRGATAGKDLGGRAFLHSYDWRPMTASARWS
jgi:uncharacterized protein YbcC (UPF0753/DUF2309 family)